MTKQNKLNNLYISLNQIGIKAVGGHHLRGKKKSESNNWKTTEICYFSPFLYYTGPPVAEIVYFINAICYK